MFAVWDVNFTLAALHLAVAVTHVYAWLHAAGP
jgi:hypothetical protein